MGEYIKNKKDMKFSSLDSLESVVNVINDAEQALGDKTRTIKDSAIPEVVAGALGAGLGGAISFGALYALGTVGLSGAGIMSGLAAAGAGASTLVGGAVSASVAGIFVLAAPVAVLAGAGVGVASSLKRKQLKQEKERLYQEAVKKHNAIIKSLEKEANASKERIEYLQGLNILLQQAVKDLKSDLGY